MYSRHRHHILEVQPGRVHILFGPEDQQSPRMVIRTSNLGQSLLVHVLLCSTAEVLYQGAREYLVLRSSILVLQDRRTVT